MKNSTIIDLSSITIAIFGFKQVDVDRLNVLIKQARQKSIILKPLSIKHALKADIIILDGANIDKYKINEKNWQQLSVIPTISIDKNKSQKYKIENSLELLRPLNWDDMLYHIVSTFTEHRINQLGLFASVKSNPAKLKDLAVASSLGKTSESESLQHASNQTKTTSNITVNAASTAVSHPVNDNSKSTVVEPSSAAKMTDSLNQSRHVDKLYKKPVTTELPANCEHNILLIDDSESIRNILSNFIIQKGYSIETAGTAEEGIRLATTKQFDCILLDVVLPDLDGYEVCKTVKNHNKDLPIIMLTSKNSSFDKFKGKMAGCDDYLTKPTTASTLFSTIGQFLK